MRKSLVALAGGLIVLICLGSAVVALLLLSQVRASPLPFLRSLVLQRQAKSQPCPPPAHLVSGTYVADPTQGVGDWTVVTYVAECDSPGAPRQAIDGYQAMNRSGEGCGGSSGHTAGMPLGTGPVAFDDISISLCGQPGRPGGLSVISGYVSVTGAAMTEAVYSSGATVRATIHGSRFVVVAPWTTQVCALRALDASGAILAETKPNSSGPFATAGACP